MLLGMMCKPTVLITPCNPLVSKQPYGGLAAGGAYFALALMGGAYRTETRCS